MIPFLELTGIDIAYPPRRVIQNLSLRMDDAGIGCLLGPSGCGKTTLLRAIAGFEPVQCGFIRLECNAGSSGLKASNSVGPAGACRRSDGGSG